MEDQRKYRTPSDKHRDKNIVELTKKMALSNQNEGDIIDLTKRVDSPDAPSAATPADEDRTPPAEPARVAPAEKDPPHKIEDEVDAAFESVQTEPVVEDKDVTPDKQLFDDLSDITERVDDAVRQHEGAKNIGPEKAPPPATEPDIPNEDSISTDAAVLEAAMGETSTNEINSDLAQPDGSADAQAAADLMDDEEIIELTDIVDPAELEQALLNDSEEEEILELTDIVDPAKLNSEPDDGEQVLESTDVVGTADNDIAADELPADWIDEMAGADDAPPADWDDEVAGTDPDLPVTDKPPESRSADSREPSKAEMLPDEKQEPVIQLSDVLGQPDKDEPVPIEKIKMGAEEDLAAQPVSIEREDAANALGLNLEMQQKIEAAVEHLLETKYADTVQQVISDAVAKAVADQMAAGKRSMQNDDDAGV